MAKKKSVLTEKKGIPVSEIGQVAGSVYISTHNKCADCNNTGMQIQTSGPRRGDIRMCPSCASNYEAYINQYGGDEAEHPELYVDMEDEHNQYIQGISAKDKQNDFILLPDGTEAKLSTNEKYGKKNII